MRSLNSGKRTKEMRAQPEIIEKIKLKGKAIEGKFAGLNVWAFIQRNIKAHPEAMLKTLERMQAQADTIRDPWPWAEAVLKIENQNFNERDYMAEHEGDKNIFAEILKRLELLAKEKQSPREEDRHERMRKDWD